MRIEHLAAIGIAGGLAVHSAGSLPPEKQSTPAAAQLATLSAESVDPFLLRSGGQRPRMVGTHISREVSSCCEL